MFVQQTLLSTEPAHKTLTWKVFNSFADINDRYVTSHCFHISFSLNSRGGDICADTSRDILLSSSLSWQSQMLR